MTDKQIIIDGVDVSGCKYFCKFTTICRNENIGRVVRPRCKNVVDCYYKQLKRAKNQIVDLNKMVEAKEQECEELQEKMKAYDEVYSNHDVLNERNKLKQTLTEIKEIASTVLLNTHDLEQFKDSDALFGALLEIHKKISEVEND